MSEQTFDDSEGYHGVRVLTIATSDPGDSPFTGVWVSLKEGSGHVDLRLEEQYTYYGKRLDPDAWLALCRASLRHLGTPEERKRYTTEES